MLRQEIEKLIYDLNARLRWLLESIQRHGDAVVQMAEEAKQGALANIVRNTAPGGKGHKEWKTIEVRQLVGGDPTALAALISEYNTRLLIRNELVRLLADELEEEVGVAMIAAAAAEEAIGTSDGDARKPSKRRVLGPPGQMA